MGDLSHFFLQISQITCLQMENFVVAILYLVYFALKYMYFEDLWVKSCEFVQNPEKWSVCWWYFPAWNLYWQVRFVKNRTRFGQFGPPEHHL